MATPTQLPKTADEAAARFFARWGAVVGQAWADVEQYLGHIHPYPKSVEEWVAVGQEVAARERARPATPPPPISTPTLAAVAGELRRPFAYTQIELKPGAFTKDKKRCLVMPYADLRTYEYRLDEVVGAEGWQTSYTMTARGVVCRLSILGVTKSGLGDYPLNQEDENPATSAQAQAFKRACSSFGLGRYLYDLPKTWADYDEASRQIPGAERVAWELYRAGGLLTPDEARKAPAAPAAPRAGGGGR